MRTRYDYLIIGGGIAGITAAETIREYEKTATIGVVSDEPHVLYSRVLLPSFLKRRIGREQVFLRRTEEFTKKNIDLRLAEQVIYVDVQKKEVGLSNRQVLGYQKLLLASGGKVRPWDKKVDPKFLYRLQTLDDADRLLREMENIQNPLVIGASFISLEFLEIFFLHKRTPTLIAQEPYFFKNILDEEGGELMRRNFERHGIRIQANDSIETVTAKGATLEIATRGLRMLQADSIALGIGVDRTIEFLQSSGIKLGTRGILTNEYLETSEPGVFAAGDVAEFHDIILEKTHVIGNWTNAFLQGKRAGLNMSGKREAFRAVPAYAITNLGFQITALGNTENGVASISRVDIPRDQYTRFFLKDDVLVGATLINRFQDKIHLTKLIETKIKLTPYKKQLSNFSFDIHTIPAVL